MLHKIHARMAEKEREDVERDKKATAEWQDMEWNTTVQITAEA